MTGSQRGLVLDQAMDIARKAGIDGLTIGADQSDRYFTASETMPQFHVDRPLLSVRSKNIQGIVFLPGTSSRVYGR